MEPKDYWTSNYLMSASQGADTLTVEKRSGTDWASVAMKVNELVPDRITIRSRNMAEQLHFMLGQMLGK